MFTIINNIQWIGGVLAPNDKIYFVQHNQNDILILDTTDESITKIHNNLDVSNAWVGGVLATDGNIYCVPFNSNKVLQIDTVAGSATTIWDGSIDLSYNTGKWAGGVLAQNGIIYCIPYNSTFVLAIDINSQTANKIYTDTIENNKTVYNLPSSTTGKWYGGTLSTNGLIYMMPYDYDKIGIIDYNTTTAGATFKQITGGTQKYVGSVLAPNGKIYGVPNYNNNIIEIKTGIPYHPPWMLAPEFNKL
jgi:hypothetical protein